MMLTESLVRTVSININSVELTESLVRTILILKDPRIPSGILGPYHINDANGILGPYHINDANGILGP